MSKPSDSGYSTEQEKFWAGSFGSDYSRRNQGDALLAANLNFFARALQRAAAIGSCIEFGANIGMNLRALRLLYPEQEQFAIEINADAVTELAHHVAPECIYQGSIQEFAPPRTWDLCLVKGVLIHIHPDSLDCVYRKLVDSCGRYLLLAEYYNPTPVAVTYRGHAERLFKRDFAGELMDRNPDLQLLDYGFSYRRDPAFPQDDITWFLMEKRG